MLKRYHEAPKDIFNSVQQYTDGDYALVHLFETDPQYFNLFKAAVDSGRDVILDNSIFELGKSFQHDRYAEWITKLQPTWYIVPDVWKNGDATVDMFYKFITKYPKGTFSSKVIGVAQGKTLKEVAQCYQSIEPYCDMIAFNLDFGSWSTLPDKGIPYCIKMSHGRRKMIGDLFKCGIINVNKPHHLLGCGVPQEILWYPRSWTFIRSLDTCNPIMCGLHEQVYDKTMPGMCYKFDDKMCDRMDHSTTVDQWRCIEENLKQISTYDSLREG